jgi:hypothetical protein
MGHQRTRAAEHASPKPRASPARRQRSPDAGPSLRQLQQNPLALAPTELIAAQQHVGHDAVAEILGTVMVQRQESSEPAADGDAGAPEMTPEEAERHVRDARDSAASQAGDGGPGGEGDGGGGGGKGGPTGSEARSAAQERADAGGGGGGAGGGAGGDAAVPQTTTEDDGLGGLAVTPATADSTIPNVAELTSGGTLANYADEKAWHDAWASSGGGVGMATGERAELVGEALGAGATEGLTGGIAAAVVGQVVKHATKSIPYASGFLAVGEMVLKGQSPVEWGAEQFSAGGKKVSDGWGKLWGGDSDWIDRIEGFVDILDGLNSFIGTISTICFIVAGVLALAGIILAIFGVGAALLTFAGFAAKAGLFLGKIATIVGIIVTALRLIIMAARAAQIMLSDADPATQSKRADSLRRSTGEFAKEVTKSFANRKADQMADEAKQRREAAARPPDQPDAVPTPAAAGTAPQAVGETQERRSVITRGLDAISAGDFSKESGNVGRLSQEGFGAEASERYLPDTARESLAGLRAAGSGETPAPAPAPAPAPTPVPVETEDGAAPPVPPTRPPGGEQLDLPFPPDPRTQIRPLTAPLPLEAIPDNAPVPQGVAPGAIGHYDPLTSAPDYDPHPFALESNPPGAPGASGAGGRMPGGRQAAGVFAEHGTSAQIMEETVPGYDAAGPGGEPRKGHGTRHQPTISVEQSTKTAKDAADAAALADIRARQAAGEDVPWEEAVVGGNVRLRDAAAAGSSQVPGSQHTKDFMAEMDFVQGDPRHGFVERRPGDPTPGPLAGADTDAHLDEAFAPYMTPTEPGGVAPPTTPTGGGPTGGATPGGAQLDLPFPAPSAATPTGEVPEGAPEAYGRRAPLSKKVPGYEERDDLVSMWDRGRKSVENEAASAITETLGFTGEDSAFAAANATPEEAAQHRQEWVADQRQKMDEAHQSMTANLPAPPTEKEAELDESAATYARLDVEERQIRFQQREIVVLEQTASDEMTAHQALQQLMAANQQAIAKEQQELDRRGQAQEQLRAKTSSMGQEAGQAGSQQQSQAGGLQQFVGRFTEMMGLVPSEVVSNSGQGSGAASQLGQGFQQSGQSTSDAAARSQAAGQHVDELASQTQECRTSFQETNAEITNLQSLAAGSLDDNRSGKAYLQQAKEQSDQKLLEIADAKQNERTRQQEAVQVMNAWAEQHLQLRTTGHAALEAQMGQVEEALPR